MIEDDWYNDLMAERDRFEQQNGELNVENQELRVQVQELQDALNKITEQRDGWSIIARQFARQRFTQISVVRLVGDHLRTQTEENINLAALVEALIPDHPAQGNDPDTAC